MRGVHPDICIHHIYIQPDITPIRQPQRRMNPNPKRFCERRVTEITKCGIYLSNF
jgi:hypothetical protein